MIDILVRVGVFLGEAVVGLLLANFIVPGFTITPTGFMAGVVVFAVLQSLLASGLTALSRKYAPALVALSGLVSTFIALIVANQLPDGITITGGWAWLWSTLIVWAFSAVASWLLRKFIHKDAKRRA